MDQQGERREHVTKIETNEDKGGERRTGRKLAGNNFTKFGKKKIRTFLGESQT